jgi:hypothetical protein
VIIALFIVGESTSTPTKPFGNAVKNVLVADVCLMGVAEDIVIGDAPHKKGVVLFGPNGTNDINLSFPQINIVWSFLVWPNGGHNKFGSFVTVDEHASRLFSGDRGVKWYWLKGAAKAGMISWCGSEIFEMGEKEILGQAAAWRGGLRETLSSAGPLRVVKMVIVFFSMLISPSQRLPRGMLRRFVRFIRS